MGWGGVKGPPGVVSDGVARHALGGELLSEEQTMVSYGLKMRPWIVLFAALAGCGGLVPGIDDQIGVRISGSAAAELANWAIEKGHAPRWYNRSIEPRETGEFRPRFDYVAEDHAHPSKVYSFQERGCSYFRVGVKAALEISGDKLKATMLDRDLEKIAANPVIEAAAWTKYFLTGWLDESKKVAAHTNLNIGGRSLETRVVKAAIVGDEVRFELQFDAHGP